jgi:DNA-binding XRE family transcriptional regulator
MATPPTPPLARALVRKGVGVAGLAAEAGLSINAMRRIVRGQQVPSVITALRIARVLEEEVEVLFAKGGWDVDDSCRSRRAGRG